MRIPVMAVTGVWGGSVSLPCEVSHPPDDSIYLLLWFRDPLTTPIYRLDERWLGRGKERHWSDEQMLGSRAELEVSTSPALLRVSSLTLNDQGLYTCRVDFKLQPTKTTRVNLTVVVPPESVSVVIGGIKGEKLSVTSVAGPYQEGNMLVLTCIAHGGVPRPSVVWFEDTHLLDSHMESQDRVNTTAAPPPVSNTTTNSSGPTIQTIVNQTSTTRSSESLQHLTREPYNTLTLGPLTRNDLKLLLTCEASNNNLTLPTSVVVMVDMNLPALSVVVRTPKLPLTAGREYQVVCEVRGSRPPPTITWYNADKRIAGAIDTNLHSPKQQVVLVRVDRWKLKHDSIMATFLQLWLWSGSGEKYYYTRLSQPLPQHHIPLRLSQLHPQGDKELFYTENRRHGYTVNFTGLHRCFHLSLKAKWSSSPKLNEPHRYRHPPLEAPWMSSLVFHLPKPSGLHLLTTSADGNVTTSTLVFTPRPEDHGSFLRCVAETRAVNATMEDFWNLTVYYLPNATASFGSSLDSGNIKEGDDVYFECSIQANPKVSHVSWRHNNEILVPNVSAGVIISNQSLVLQGVVRAQAGRYSCHAHNVVGDGSSNTLRLDVKCEYLEVRLNAPVCSPGQVTSYAVSRDEDAEVTCSVQANPLQATFQWTFNNTADTIDVPKGRFTSSSSHSVITYTPMTSLDYGTLLCWASNEIGTQREPCVFHIVPAGKPDPPSNCTIGSRTRTSVRVKCVAGGSGGLTQQFFLQARLQDGQHVLNLTSSSPAFLVEGLQTGQKYDLVISSFNDKGFSTPAHVTVFSTGANGSIYQPHDGPSEAEVRDGGKNGGGIGSVIGGVSGSDANNKYLSVLAMPSLIPAALGVGAGLILIIIVLILLITFRTRHPRHHSPQHDTPTQDTEPEDSPQHHKSPVITHHASCLERDIQVESESDADPDVIPLQEGCRPPDPEPAAAILLPPDRYKYAPVPALVPAAASAHYGGVTTSPSTTSLKSGDHSSFTLPYDSDKYGGERLHSNIQVHCSSTLPRHTSRPPKEKCHSSTINPHQFPFPGIEGSLPPPPVEYQNSRRKRTSLGSGCSQSGCEEDTPSTPLLGKRESSV
ncbi:Nephrin-like 2 [Homarus americanus]|uniref:Nephrin-like 2 n=1 Tax=Homarus americanus TaxID=6706 RepID=A0A8J5JVY0_HOMAM|nr:Nephrin-like 2 [Homarus americanus]